MRDAVVAAGLGLVLGACGSGHGGDPAAGDGTAATGGSGGTSAPGTGRMVVGGSGGSGAPGDTAGSGGPDAAGGAAGASSTGGFSLDATLTDANGGAPLPAASVCLFQAPTTCVQPDASGSFSIDGIAATRAGFTVSLAGYATGIWPITPNRNLSGWSILLRSQTRMGRLAQQAGATFGAGAGVIVFTARDGGGNNIAGVSIKASSAGRVGYFTADGSALDATLTATTANGTGFVFNVGPGDVAVTFSAPGKTCVRYSAEGWPGADGQTAVVPVRDGAVTRAVAACQ